MFGDLHAGNRSQARLEFAADLGRNGRLHVPDVKLARAAVEKEEDHRLGSRRNRLGTQHSRQRQPEETESPQLKPFAARRAAPHRMIRNMQHPLFLLGWRLRRRGRAVNRWLRRSRGKKKWSLLARSCT